MNNQNIHQFSDEIDKTISIGKRIKDKYNNSKKSPRDNSGLKPTFDNEQYEDSGVAGKRASKFEALYLLTIVSRSNTEG